MAKKEKFNNKSGKNLIEESKKMKQAEDSGLIFSPEKVLEEAEKLKKIVEQRKKQSEKLIRKLERGSKK